MDAFLTRLGIEENNSGAATSGFLDVGGRTHTVVSPTNGKPIANVQLATTADYEKVLSECERAFAEWRMLPAPKRGEIVREIGQALRDNKEDLGHLISLEVGKILSEGMGEVQESVDMADFCVGLSRQLYGLSMHSERVGHRMYEQWHPLGVTAVITAFNFPNAVWAWNAMVAAVCGNTVLWKPSLKASLTAIATHRVCDEVMQKHGWGGVFGLVIGDDKDVGDALINDRRIPLVSATGSTRMGRHVGQVVAGRLGRCLLELGGNNAIIVHKDAPLDIALGGVVFGAVGTAGQRCTSTRRLYLHEDIAESFTQKLVTAYESIEAGNPMEEGTLLGPLIDGDAVRQFTEAIEIIKEQGGEILAGGTAVDRPGSYVRPTVVKAHAGMAITKQETFAPILYVFSYSDIDDAIHANNDVDQGLSSAVFTDSFRVSERFLSHRGSDCGIANVNIGTSGAEIGGAFGGEKDTGGGREAGADSWKAYMRRQTCTLNWSTELPLAQGVKFDF